MPQDKTSKTTDTPLDGDPIPESGIERLQERRGVFV
jgi:hypothetical protein